MSEPRLSREGLPAGSRVLCAVSGGADSVCLLSLLREAGDLEVLCAHYDHGIRGEDSQRDAAFVRELCEAWDIPFYTERGDVPALARERSLGIEEAARLARYDFLYRIKAETRADCIATAHNMNDNAETVLLAMARGTGLRGLGGIPPVRNGIVRPLLHVPRAEIEAYLRERGIAWREDASNQSDDYARNRARHALLPALEALHGGAAANIDRMTETLREDEAFLSSLAEAFLAEQGEALSVSALSALPKPVAARTVQRWLGGGVSRERIEAVLALCRGNDPSAMLDLPGGRVRREYDRLFRSEANYLPLKETILTPGEPFICGDWLVQAEILPSGAEIQSSFNIFTFSCDNICGMLFLTPRREGDAILLHRRAGTRSVKKLLIEYAVPAARRDSWPILRDAAGVLAVYGVGQAERAFPAPGERMIRITIRENIGRKL